MSAAPSYVREGLRKWAWKIYLLGGLVLGVLYYVGPPATRSGWAFNLVGFSAVIAANDLCAIGALDTVLRAGITVPGDLSIIGYDDSRFGRLPGIDLTSVRQDIKKQARFAVKAVVERLDRPSRKPRNIASRPQLIVRGTTAAPRQRSDSAGS